MPRLAAAGRIFGRALRIVHHHVTVEKEQLFSYSFRWRDRRVTSPPARVITTLAGVLKSPFLKFASTAAGVDRPHADVERCAGTASRRAGPRRTSGASALDAAGAEGDGAGASARARRRRSRLGPAVARA